MYPSSQEVDECPIIIDPITGNNVAQMSFRINEVRNVISDFFDILNNSKLLFDKKDMSDNINVIHEVFYPNLGY